MAKANRPAARPLPSTPSTAQRPESGDAAPRVAHQSAGEGRAAIQTPADRWPGEAEYLVLGTGCRAGHDEGEELIEPRLGKVPSRRMTRIGVGLLVWVLLGLVFLAPVGWTGLALIAGLLWLGFSGIVQRRSGHRGHCWRTRSWRYAWGGLVPTPKTEDPTRPADGEED